MSPHTPLFFQTVNTLVQQLASITTPQERDNVIIQLLTCVEQNRESWHVTDPAFFLENSKARTLTLTTLEDYAEYIPLSKIVSTQLFGDPQIGEIIQKQITRRKAEIPAQLFVDALISQDYSTRYAAIQGLKALGEYAPTEALVETVNSRDVVIASIAAEAIVLRKEQQLLQALLESFMELHWSIQLAILRTMNQLDIPIELDLLEYAHSHRAIEMRKVALRALGKRGKDAPIHVIEKALEDGFVELEALEALGSITEYTNNRRFLEIVKNGEARAELQIAAANILLARGHQVPVQPLLHLLTGPDLYEPLPQQIKAILHEIGENGVEEILEYAQDSATLLAQLASAQILGIWGEPAATETLTQMVQDGRFDERTRQKVLEILREQKDQAASEVIWSVLENNEESGHLRQLSHDTLKDLGQIDEYEMYLPFPGGAHRFTPLDSLGKREENLENLLVALPERIRTMQSEQKEPQEIAQTVESVLREYSSQDFTILFGEEQVNEEIQPFPINHMIQNLSSLRDERALPILKALHHHDDPMIHFACTSALQNVETGDTFEPIEQQNKNEVGSILTMLHVNEANIRQEALRKAAEQGTNFPIEPLLEALEDPVYEVRAEAMRVLHAQKARVPVEIFLKGLTMECEGGLPDVYGYERDFEQPVPVEAARALGELHEVHAIEPLLALLENQYEEIRAAALETLGLLGEQVPLTPVVQTFADESVIVREAACQALEAQSRDGRAIPFEPLVAALGDNDSYRIPLHEERWKRYPPANEGLVRKAAAQALLSLQVEKRFSLLPELKATLAGGEISPLFNNLVACYVADLINEVGYASPVFLKKLMELLDHSSWEVRMKAVEAFSSLAAPLSKELEDRLIVLHNTDKYAGVHKAVEEALQQLKI